MIVFPLGSKLIFHRVHSSSLVIWWYDQQRSSASNYHSLLKTWNSGKGNANNSYAYKHTHTQTHMPALLMVQRILATSYESNDNNDASAFFLSVFFFKMVILKWLCTCVQQYRILVKFMNQIRLLLAVRAYGFFACFVCDLYEFWEAVWNWKGKTSLLLMFGYAIQELPINSFMFCSLINIQISYIINSNISISLEFLYEWASTTTYVFVQNLINFLSYMNFK